MGVLGGIPGTTKHPVQQVDNLPPGAHWQAIGHRRGAGAAGGCTSRSAATYASGWRTPYIAPGQLAQSNGELVAALPNWSVGGRGAGVGERGAGDA